MATVYLDASTGSDAYTYAQAQSILTPWLTPGKVQTSAVAGDTVVMAAGTYTWASVSFTKNFTWTGVIGSDGIPTVILDGAAANVVWTITANITVTGVIFQNAIRSANTGWFEGSSSSSLTWSFTNCVFRSLTFTHINQSAAIFQKGTGNNNVVTITRCLIYSISGWVLNATFLLVGCRNGSGGSVTLTGNTIYLATAGQLACVLFDGNAATTSTLTLKNNIIFNNLGVTLTFSANMTGYTQTLTNNCFVSITSVPAGTANITSDPLFVDATNAKFNLRPTSPAIGTGTLT